MKIGIALTGISYNDQVVPGTNWGRKRDWREAQQSTLSMIVRPLKKCCSDPVDIEFYLYSYDNSQRNEIRDAYAPKKSTWITGYEGTTMATTFLEGLKQLRGENLDLVIATRFDIVILYNIIRAHYWDFSKFNFLFREKGWKDYNFTTDTFYVFPYNMLEDVILSLEDMINNPPPPKNIGMHNLYTPLAKRIGEANINIACGDEEYLSHSNTIFTLTREE